MYADLSVYYDQISAIRLIPLPGDADYNGAVDLADLVDAVAVLCGIDLHFITPEQTVVKRSDT